MRWLALSILLFLQTSCETYKISPRVDMNQVSVGSEIALKKNEIPHWPGFPEGLHCFEPLLYILTVGVIPTHCVERYTVLSDSVEVGQAKITWIGGWAALVIAPLPDWRFGIRGRELYTESEIIKAVKLGN